jgi:MarR family transcriptional regulator for hemolysin
MADDHLFAAGDFARRMFRLGQNWRREIDVGMRRFGLTEATWRPLLHLGRYGDGVRQTDLAVALDIEAPSLVRLLDALENAGLVERCEDKDDRRSKTLKLTKAGRRTYHTIVAEYQTINELLLEQVSTGDIETCTRLLDLVEQTMARRAAARNEAKQ